MTWHHTWKLWSRRRSFLCLLCLCLLPPAHAVRPNPKVAVDRAARPSKSVGLLLQMNGTHSDELEDDCPQCDGIFLNHYAVLRASSRPQLLAAGIILIAVVLTWLMMDTTRAFFLPVLFFWSKYLRLSPEMSAATLLALGNSAPDMADALAAAELHDLPLGLSDLGGSNLCALTLNALVLLVAYLAETSEKGDTLHHSGRYWLLLGFYSFAVVLTVFTVRKARLNFWSVCPLPALYCVYLCYLAYKGREDETERYIRLRKRRRSSTDAAMDNALACLSIPFGEDETACNRILWAMMLPFTVIRLATMPPCDMRWDGSRRICHAVSPVGLYFLFVVRGYVEMPDLKHAAIAAAVLLPLCVLIYIAGDKPAVIKGTRADLPWLYMPMTLVGLVSAVLWLAALSKEITAILEGVCRYFQVSRLRSGFTLLAWGNCASDLVAAYSLAVMNEYPLALHGIVATQFFNLSVGFPSSLLVITWRSPNLAIFENGWPGSIRDPLLVCTCSIAVAVSTLALYSMFDLQVKSISSAMVLILNYLLFLIFMWLNTTKDVPQQLSDI